MNTALILSGGVGSRLGGDMPKQYIEVGGRILLSYCLERLSRHPLVDAVQIVAQEEWQGTIRSCLKRYDINKKFRGFSNPGENRQLSIYNGLRDILTYAAGTDDTVLVHDGARPCLQGALITECVNALERHDGVIPVLPMKDTVYVSSDGKHVSSLLNRGEIFAGQAPELFVLGKYYEANERLLPHRIFQINGSTEAAVLGGMDIVMIPGDEGNYKITTRADLERFREFISQKEDTMGEISK